MAISDAGFCFTVLVIMRAKEFQYQMIYVFNTHYYYNIYSPLYYRINGSPSTPYQTPYPFRSLSIFL